MNIYTSSECAPIGEAKITNSNPPIDRDPIEPVFYMAHPIQSDAKFDFNSNMSHVVEMLGFFSSLGIRCIAPYHTIILANANRDPAAIKAGLETDIVVVKQTRRLILVGHKISSGMKDELLAAREASAIVWNFVGLSRRGIAESPEVRNYITDIESAKLLREHKRLPEHNTPNAYAIGCSGAVGPIGYR